MWEKFKLFMLMIPADERVHVVRALAIPECYALTPPLFFLFNQPRSPTRPTPYPAWVMACVDFLSLWEVVLHGLPLSSCFHACPFNRLGNPSWYLYRPWFSWYSCSLSSSPFTSPLQSCSFSLARFGSPIWLHLLYLTIPPHFVSHFLITCSSSEVSLYSNSSYRHNTPPRKPWAALKLSEYLWTQISPS